MRLKNEIEAPAGCAATEHTETEFHIDDALAKTLGSLQAIDTQEPILIRVIDHACSSEYCISYRLVAMLRSAHWNISADLCNDQPLDACGYIAADAVCRLREAALSDADSWHDIQLPDYAQQECISRGNKLLRKKDYERILDTNEVNRLVRHYSHLDQRHQAAEEWWGGAVALDHFLTGLPNIVEAISSTSSHAQHRWRAWAVNTQTSRQLGSHWFTVVVGIQAQQLMSTAEYLTSTSSSCPLSTADDLGQSTGEHRMTASCSQSQGTGSTANQLVQSSSEHQIISSSLRSLDTADELVQSTGEHAVPAYSSQPLRAAHYPNVFGSPSSALSEALLWAHTNARLPRVASWLEACSQWDSAIAAGEHENRKKTTEALQRSRHPMYEDGRFECKARCRDGIHPPRTR